MAVTCGQPASHLCSWLLSSGVNLHGSCLSITRGLLTYTREQSTTEQRTSELLAYAYWHTPHTLSKSPFFACVSVPVCVCVEDLCHPYQVRGQLGWA